MSFKTLSKVSLALSAALVVVSTVLFVSPGPRYSIEFTGGTLIQLQLPEGKTRDDLLGALDEYEAASATDLGNVAVSAVKTAAEEAFVLRMRPMENEEHVAIIDFLREKFGDVTELRYTVIGPSLSASLKTKSLQAILIASIAVIAYLAIAFRKLPRRLNPWKIGTIVVVAFIHDVVVTIGAFIVVGWYTSFEFDTLFVTALLTILAYSTNEAIVVLDRIRANLPENKHEDLAKIVVIALKQCIGRTFGTTVSILIVLTTLFFMGSESIRWFILALIFGAIMGVYSSYLVATPLLLYWQGKDGKR